MAEIQRFNRLLTIRRAKSAGRASRSPGGDTMPISGIPIFSMLRTKLHWHQERQRVLAENVPNADTPEFKPSDLAAPKFDVGPSGAAPLTLLRTSPVHLATSDGAATFDPQPGHAL